MYELMDWGDFPAQLGASIANDPNVVWARKFALSQAKAKENDAMPAKWDRRFLDLAEHVAGWSKDPGTKLGAVAVNDRRQILSTGYNGLPAGIEDTAERLNDRETKYALTIHAEMNCIYSAAHNGVSLHGATMYVSGLPVCSDCAKALIQVGVKRVVMRHAKSIGDKWAESFKLTSEMFHEADVRWEVYVNPDD